MLPSPIDLLNLFSPKSWRSRLIARDVPYGPNIRQRLDVYAPRRTDGPLPIITFFYGGSWNEGDRHSYRFVGRFLASRGFLVVVPDYRLIPEVTYPDFLSDSASAITWTAANAQSFGGDPGRLAVMGHSAGAYNAVMTALDPSLGATPLIRAAVGLSGPYDFLPFSVPATQQAFGGAKHKPSTQPVNLVTPQAPPMFLATGDADRTVLPRNTGALATRLREAGVAVVERHYAGLGHAGLLLELGTPLGRKVSLAADVEAFLGETMPARA